MVQNHQQLSNAIDAVHEMMLAAKQKPKNAALLRNLTGLKPAIHNKTRWSGKRMMLKRWVATRDELIEVASSDESVDVTINTAENFKARVEKFTRQMREINVVKVRMQTRCIALEKCRSVIDMLVSNINQHRDTPESLWCGCRFESIKTAPAPDLAPDHLFEPGVVKIQRGQASDLTDAEKAAVECLKQEHPVAAGGAAGNEEAQSPLDMLAQIRRMNERGGQQDCGTGDCVNCNFICRSAAEVERLWSISDSVLRNNRKRMTPQLFEANTICTRLSSLRPVVGPE
jgi:hypothetical protein